MYTYHDRERDRERKKERKKERERKRRGSFYLPSVRRESHVKWRSVGLGLRSIPARVG